MSVSVPKLEKLFKNGKILSKKRKKKTKKILIQRRKRQTKRLTRVTQTATATQQLIRILPSWSRKSPHQNTRSLQKKLSKAYSIVRENHPSRSNRGTEKRNARKIQKNLQVALRVEKDLQAAANIDTNQAAAAALVKRKRKTQTEKKMTETQTEKKMIERRTEKKMTERQIEKMKEGNETNPLTKRRREKRKRGERRKMRVTNTAKERRKERKINLSTKTKRMTVSAKTKKKKSRNIQRGAETKKRRRNTSTAAVQALAGTRINVAVVLHQNINPLSPLDSRMR